MNIIYYSNLVSTDLLNEICKKFGAFPSQAIQKFHKLLTSGLDKQTNLFKISSLPIPNNKAQSIDFNSFKEKNQLYTGFFKNKYIRQIFNVIFSFIYTIKIHKKNKIQFGIFDYLNQSVTFGGYLACRLLKINTVVVVTDLPQFQYNNKNFINKLYLKILIKFLNSFDSYVLLTEHMNEIVNKKSKPYIVMEGLVDSQYNKSVVLEKKQVLLYAGGLYEKYGVKKLINAFLALESNDFQLHLYGWGDLEEYIKSCEVNHNNIKFFGVVPNNEIVKLLPECTLLVNPRPSSLELSKFSFPSKTLEYMLSSTPVVTTKLQGIPEDYFPYLYFFEDESELGIKKTLEKLLSLPKEELNKKGEYASDFVLKHKSNMNQAKKIVEFLISN